MNYNTKYMCTYAFYDPELRLFCSEKFDLEDVAEFEEMSDDIYRSELLNIFNLKTINDKEAETSMTALFNILKIDDFFLKCSTILSAEDPEYGFSTLFSYDTLFLWHPCICEYFEKGQVSELNKKRLLDKILKN